MLLVCVCLNSLYGENLKAISMCLCICRFVFHLLIQKLIVNFSRCSIQYAFVMIP